MRCSIGMYVMECCSVGSDGGMDGVGMDGVGMDGVGVVIVGVGVEMDEVGGSTGVGMEAVRACAYVGMEGVVTGVGLGR